MKKLVILLVFQVMANSFALATVLDFDALPARNLYQTAGWVPNGYGDLSWDNFMVYDATMPAGLSGMPNGMISPRNIILNAYAEPARVHGGPINFTGAWLTALFRDNLNIQLAGYRNGDLIYSRTVTAQWSHATWFNFDFINIDQLTFDSFGGVNHPGLNGSGTVFLLDNFTYQSVGAIVPEPATLMLIGMGLMGGVLFRRRQNYC